LTALRQFLRSATIHEPLPNLSVERIHLALKRLPIERRRPYQILSEDEWAAFLETARQPMTFAIQTPQAERQVSAAAPSPWGRTRVERLRAQAEQAETPVSAKPDVAETAARPLRANDGRTGALTAQRDFALAALALATGLRAIELSLVDVGDLTHERRRGQDEWWLTLPDEKTKGQRGGRVLPLAADLIALLSAYICATGRSLATPSDRAAPLFLALPRGPRADADSSRPRRLRPEQIRTVINRIETQWLARQNVESGAPDLVGEARRISPHALRHSAAIALLKGNEETGRPPASVEHVRGWLGHFDIRTTQRYLDHLNSREERRRFAITPQTPLTQPSPGAPTDETTETEESTGDSRS
jgi:integrase